MAEGGETPLQIGQQRAAREQGGFSYRNAQVAEVDGEVAGMVLGYRQPDPYDSDGIEELPVVVRPLVELESLAPGSWYLNGIATLEEYRGRGIGSALLQAAEAVARQSSAKAISLIVAAENSGAKRLYERNGYRPQGQRPLEPWPGCEYSGDWLLLVKDLN